MAVTCTHLLNGGRGTVYSARTFTAFQELATP